MKNLITKIAIFDFDGTLTKSSAGGNCWRYVWEKIGKTDVDDRLYEQYLSGQFSQEVWVKKCINEFRESKVDKNLIYEIAKTLKIRDGVEETFQFLKAHNVKIYIYSGGIRNIIECCLKDMLKYIDKIVCEELVFDENGVVCGNIKPEFDTEDKKHFIQEIVKTSKIKPSEIFFVGNGKNDENAHRAGVTTLCINPDKTDPLNKQCWDFYIPEIKNFTQIHEFIK